MRWLEIINITIKDYDPINYIHMQCLENKIVT